MTTNFPTSLDSLSNPTAGTAMNSASLGHASQHANINDAMEAVQAKVGINNSTVSTALDVRAPTICTSTTRPTGVQGRTIYETDTGRLLVYYGASTGWKPPWGLPWGVVGYATTTSSSNGSTSNNVFADWPTMSVTWTAVDTRLYRTTVHGHVETTNTGGDWAELLITTGAGSALSRSRQILATNVRQGAFVAYVEGALLGSTTRKVMVNRASGAGTVSGYAASGFQASIVVEDLGPTSAVAPSS